MTCEIGTHYGGRSYGKSAAFYCGVVADYEDYPRQTIERYGLDLTIKAHSFYLNHKYNFYDIRLKEQNSPNERCI